MFPEKLPRSVTRGKQGEKLPLLKGFGGLPVNQSLISVNSVYSQQTGSPQKQF